MSAPDLTTPDSVAEFLRRYQEWRQWDCDIDDLGPPMPSVKDIGAAIDAAIAMLEAPYPGMSEAFERHFSQSFTDREWRAESGIWAAAWKAAKNHGAQPAMIAASPEANP